MYFYWGKYVIISYWFWLHHPALLHTEWCNLIIFFICCPHQRFMQQYTVQTVQELETTVLWLRSCCSILLQEVNSNCFVSLQYICFCFLFSNFHKLSWLSLQPVKPRSDRTCWPLQTNIRGPWQGEKTQLNMLICKLKRCTCHKTLFIQYIFPLDRCNLSDD